MLQLLISMMLLACVAPLQELDGPLATFQDPIEATEPIELAILMRDGDSIRAQEFRFEGDQIVLDLGGEEREISFDVISMLFFMEGVGQLPDTHYLVRLVDGSEIYCTELIGLDRNLQLNIDGKWQAITDTRNVDYAQIKTLDSQAAKTNWIELLDQRPKAADALIINREGALEYFEGVIGDIDADRIDFSTQDRNAQVKRERLSGWVYYHASGRELPDANCFLTTTTESKLAIREINSDENGDLNLTLVCGAEISLPLSFVRDCNFSLGRELFLSEIPPTTMDWEPLIASKSIEETLRRLKIPRVNEAYGGGKLTLRFYTEPGIPAFNKIQQFERGFAVSGGSRLAFGLEGKYKALTGKIGFAPTVGENGNVNLVLRGDGEVILEQVMRQDEYVNPIELDLSVEGIERLSMEVQYHDRRSVGDILHFCDLKVVK